MGKNTGRGFRVGAVRGRSQTKIATGYVKRDTTTGRFLDVKSDGKPFKGVTRKPSSGPAAAE